MVKELVIAAYDKDLSWLNKLDKNIIKTIYRKGDKKSYENEILITQNMGRCVHSFFNHIYINYDNLSDYIFFVQDYPFDHWENIVDILNNNLWEENYKLKIGGYYGFHFNTVGTMWKLNPSKHFENGNIISCHSNGYPQDHNSNINVDKYWDILFNEKKPNMYEFIPGGHFGISKEHIKLRSKSFYKKIVDLLLEDITAPWMIERLECYIFDPKHYNTKF
jgi:hypothetical protein